MAIYAEKKIQVTFGKDAGREDRRYWSSRVKPGSRTRYSVNTLVQDEAGFTSVSCGEFTLNGLMGYLNGLIDMDRAQAGSIRSYLKFVNGCSGLKQVPLTADELKTVFREVPKLEELLKER